jgi:hypothetical protein
MLEFYSVFMRCCGNMEYFFADISPVIGPRPYISFDRVPGRGRLAAERGYIQSSPCNAKKYSRALLWSSKAAVQNFKGRGLSSLVIKRYGILVIRVLCYATLSVLKMLTSARILYNSPPSSLIYRTGLTWGVRLQTSTMSQILSAMMLQKQCGIAIRPN